MAGNVAEWVMDVYRPEIEQTTISDHRNFRGNVYTTQKTDEDGFIAEKDSLGRITMIPVDVQGNIYRRNYKKSDNINYLDGDIESQMGIDWNSFLEEITTSDTARVQIDKWNKKVEQYKDNAKTGNSSEMYAYGESSLVTDRTRVFKGKYRVLGGTLSALDAVGPEELKIPRLIQRVLSENVTEVILALNSTMDGQTTSHYIADQLELHSIKVSSLAQGVPIGGELDYLDEGTISAALRARINVT